MLPGAPRNLEAPFFVSIKGLLQVASFADLSAGMLMVHLFTVDSRWPGMLEVVRDRFIRSGSAAPASTAS
jgi:hypothetical protein